MYIKKELGKRSPRTPIKMEHHTIEVVHTVAHLYYIRSPCISFGMYYFHYMTCCLYLNGRFHIVGIANVSMGGKVANKQVSREYQRYRAGSRLVNQSQSSLLSVLANQTTLSFHVTTLVTFFFTEGARVCWCEVCPLVSNHGVCL